MNKSSFPVPRFVFFVFGSTEHDQFLENVKRMTKVKKMEGKK